MATLKIVILADSETKSKSELLTVLFYGNMWNFTRGCVQMVVTIDVVTENMCMNRRWKADQVSYGIRKQPSPRFTRLRP
jgi:hypothetical protein